MRTHVSPETRLQFLVSPRRSLTAWPSRALACPRIAFFALCLGYPVNTKGIGQCHTATEGKTWEATSRLLGQPHGHAAAVRTACNTRQAEIDACSDVPALKELLFGAATITRQETDGEGNGVVDSDARWRRGRPHHTHTKSSV